MKKERLYYCNAYIEYRYKGQVVLISYNTPVAIIDEHRDLIAIYRYNSATTAQHLRKFQRWLYYNMPFEYYQRFRDLLNLGVKQKARVCFDYHGKNTDLFKYSYDYLKLFISFLNT